MIVVYFYILFCFLFKKINKISWGLFFVEGFSSSIPDNQQLSRLQKWLKSVQWLNCESLISICHRVTFQFIILVWIVSIVAYKRIVIVSSKCYFKIITKKSVSAKHLPGARLRWFGHIKRSTHRVAASGTTQILLER